MCGLAGELRTDGSPADPAAVAGMTACMVHRGPDGNGLWASGPVALGHRRLSIIDLSTAGAQPMVDAPEQLSLVFNGCIYNYEALRDELRAAGHVFFSTSDTEVVEKAYADRYFTPIWMAPEITSNKESSPRAWPSVRDSPRALAHRPLPSMTIATWRGTRSAGIAGGSAPSRCGAGGPGGPARRPQPSPPWPRPR